MNSAAGTLTLSNGTGIPCLGFGTWETPDGQAASDSVRTAIEAGYRLVDTAAVYGNEAGVGEGVRAGIASAGISREDVFVTSKMWNTERGHDSALAAFDATMERLGLDYLDLYLVHWPAAPHRFDDWRELNLQTWRAFEELYEAGRVRAIGVSNFKPSHLEPLLAEARVAPMVNQIEFHPGFLQEETRAFCADRAIVVEAWRPLGKGRLLEDAALRSIAARRGITPAQACLRWCIQHGTVPLAKSVRPDRIVSNADVFGFELDGSDMMVLDGLGVGRLGGDPDSVGF